MGERRWGAGGCLFWGKGGLERETDGGLGVLLWAAGLRTFSIGDCSWWVN